MVLCGVYWLKRADGRITAITAKPAQGFVSKQNNIFVTFVILQHLWSILYERWVSGVAFPASRAVEDHGAQLAL
jgi:hypothetical protein